MSKRKPIGLFVSDLHLSSKRPSCRVDDWIRVQEDLLYRISGIAAKYQVPIFACGDIFDKPKEDPVIEALAIRWMKKNKWYGIPGQHDLPGHSLSRIGESSFGVLMEAGVLQYVEGTGHVDDFLITGFPYGIHATCAVDSNKLKVAIAHEMVWRKQPFPGAPEKGNVKKLVKRYPGFDVLVFGDNHKGFSTRVKGVSILNCGTALQRTVVEHDYFTQCFLLYSDGSHKSIPYILQSSWRTVDLDLAKREKALDDRIRAFVKTIQGDKEVSLSFIDNLKEYLESSEVSDSVKEVIWKAMEEVESNG